MANPSRTKFERSSDASLSEVVADIRAHERESMTRTPIEVQERYERARWLGRRLISREYPYAKLDLEFRLAMDSIPAALRSAQQHESHIVIG